ncbi:MAG: hypothetical protein KDK71_09125, partial [Chlamydiia bacterium]|nr:hypothetical protein [Chlamydiia bacterium]
GHYLLGNIDLKKQWPKHAFFWEKIELYKMCTLYYLCLKRPRKAAHFEALARKEFDKCALPLSFI